MKKEWTKRIGQLFDYGIWVRLKEIEETLFFFPYVTGNSSVQEIKSGELFHQVIFIVMFGPLSLCMVFLKPLD